MGPQRAARRRPSRRRTPRARPGERAAQGRARARAEHAPARGGGGSRAPALLRGPDREQDRPPPGRRARAEGAGHRHLRAPPGRDRHRQGAVRPAHPRQRPAPRRQVRRAELRGPPRVLAGVRALRAHPGGLHRRHGRAQGPVRGGRRRHDLPRRGRRDVAGHAATASPRAPGGRDPARRGVDAPEGRCPGAGRDQRRARGGGGERPLPEGRLLPAQRVPDLAATPPRPRRGHCEPGRALPARVPRAGAARGAVDLAGSDAVPARLPVPGERARARERDRARSGARRPRPARLARSTSPRACARGPRRAPRPGR